MSIDDGCGGGGLEDRGFCFVCMCVFFLLNLEVILAPSLFFRLISIL
jgi:hypothetical protein